MVFREAEVDLFCLLAQERFDPLVTVGAVLQGLGTGRVHCCGRVRFDEPAHSHDGPDRFRPACISCRLRPLAAVLSKD